MSRQLVVLILCTLLFISGCHRNEAPSNAVTKLYGGSEAIRTVQNASSVQAYRLPSQSFHVDSLSEYTMTAGPIPVPAATVAELRQVLMDDSIYVWESVKACGEPEYGVRFQFQRDGESVDVLVCFHCDMLGVYHNGRSVGKEDCDAARDTLIGIAKQLFPDDSVIQGLK